MSRAAERVSGEHSAKQAGEASTEAISEIPRPAAAGGWFPCRTGVLVFSSHGGLRQPEPNGWSGRGEKSVYQGLVKASQNGRSLKAGTLTNGKGRP
jgi:hypothetical protein